MPSRPALLVAAPASGQGKTTVTAALARMYVRAGHRVRVFKCGPDFLDPQILAVASGAPVYNLDFGMCGETDAKLRLACAAKHSDVILIEGVMGLFDGSPSAADIACRFDIPVMGLIDASAMAQTFGAIAHGLAHYRSGLPFSGVLANKVGGEYHAKLLRESLPAGMRWYGALPRDEQAALPERHLGLLQAEEIGGLEARLDRLAATLQHSLGNQAAFPPAVEFPEPENYTLPPLLKGKTIAVARDAAFGFIYPANVDTLLKLGATLAFFSPLAHEALPVCDAVWFPGGYPELHAAQLAAHGELWRALRDHVGMDKPVLAECGGMMALFDALIDAAGTHHAMAGLLPGNTAMQPRLAALGTQVATLPEGELRGHTFHYSKCDTPLMPFAHAAKLDGNGGEAIYRHGSVTASYVHFYFPSNPQAIAALFGHA